MSAYIVTTNNPFHPMVSYFETLEEATRARDQRVQDLHVDDGVYRCKATIAKIVETVDFRSYY
jgi:hypothetical protein